MTEFQKWRFWVRFHIFKFLCNIVWKICPRELRDVLLHGQEIGHAAMRKLISEERAARRRKDFTVIADGERVDRPY